LEQPDLVLLDIILPGAIDGYQVAQRLREFSDMPIIMLTAKVRETDMLRGFDVGAMITLPSLQLQGIAGAHPGGPQTLQENIIQAALRRSSVATCASISPVAR